MFFLAGVLDIADCGPPADEVDGTTMTVQREEEEDIIAVVHTSPPEEQLIVTEGQEEVEKKGEQHCSAGQGQASTDGISEVNVNIINAAGDTATAIDQVGEAIKSGISAADSKTDGKGHASGKSVGDGIAAVEDKSNILGVETCGIDSELIVTDGQAVTATTMAVADEVVTTCANIVQEMVNNSMMVATTPAAPSQTAVGCTAVHQPGSC